MIRKLFAAGLLMGVMGVTAVALPAAETPADTPKTVTFNKDVLPILQRSCQGCHRPGQVAPMSLLDYQSARPWAKAMKKMVVSREMPPWNADPKYGHFANDRSLKQSEIALIATWADQGAPEGNAKDKPAPIQWPDNGWQLKPDVIVDLPKQNVPAHTDKNDAFEWATLVVPGPFKQDTWISSIEILPDHYKLTHHICMGFLPHREDVIYNTPERRKVERDERGNELRSSRSQGQGNSRRNIIGNTGNEYCYLPGTQAADYRIKNAGKLVPANADIYVTLHYTPNGTEAVDQPHIGFTLAKQPPERRWFNYTIHGLQDEAHFAIPPNDPNWPAPTVAVTLLTDAELVWMMPHMHLRGKDMTYNIIYPDGTAQTVLRVPHFDFEWQLGYEAAEPIKLPRGTHIVVTGHFDNSKNNNFNPDPNATVYYGDMNWEEMFSGYIGVIVDPKVDSKKILRDDTTAGRAGTSDGG
jgi:hypothetical protein